MKEYSKNDKAKEALGCRLDGHEGKNIIPFDLPESFNYKCPVCGNKHMDWSEYNVMLRCSKCDLDIPTPFCTGLKEGIDMFIDIIKYYKGK